MKNFILKIDVKKKIQYGNYFWSNSWITCFMQLFHSKLFKYLYNSIDHKSKLFNRSIDWIFVLLQLFKRYKVLRYFQFEIPAWYLF